MKITKERITRTLQQLYGLSDFETRRTTSYVEAHYNLTGIKALLHSLNHPERTFKSYHIAGTKGKGTTAFYVSKLLSLHKSPVGLYTSPHIFDLRERFTIKGAPLDWEILIPVLEFVLTKAMSLSVRVTLFDVLTATAFLCFREQGVKWAVLETGLGGRWDSTNVLNSSELSATLITRIDYDHMDKLGKTLTAIAREKVEIFKPGIPAFYLQDNPSSNSPVPKNTYEAEVGTVLKEKAASLGNTLMGVSIHKTYPLYKKRIKDACATLEKLGKNEFNQWFPSVFRENLLLALSAVETVEGKHFSATEIAAVLKQNRPLGRYTFYKNILLDGAHTPLSLATLVNEIQQAPFRETYKSVTFGFYAFFDKPIEKLVEKVPVDWDFVFCNVNLPFVRAELTEQVCAKAKAARKALGASFREVKSVQALEPLKNPDQLFVFGGSFKLVASVCEEVLGMTSVLKDSL